MGRKSVSGGVRAKNNGIEYDLFYDGRRIRPTEELPPTQSNLKYARHRRGKLMAAIENGTFDIHREFPEYRYLEDFAQPKEKVLFSAMAERYLRGIADHEHATIESYRKILNHFWLPRIGQRPLEKILASDLKEIVGQHPWRSAKTRNNVVSVVRLVLAAAVDDGIIPASPAERIRSRRVQRKPPKPYSISEATTLMDGMREDWGDGDANYVAVGFFGGFRPSELIAARRTDFNESTRRLTISRARVMGRDKDTTKTAVLREVELCPRAFAHLVSHLQYCDRRQREDGWPVTDHIFVDEHGQPYHDLQRPWKKWRATHRRLNLPYRVPYQMRHTSVTWNLMIGKNVLWVAEQHGHSPAVMLKTYAKWIRGTTSDDVAAIKAAMGYE